MSNLSPAVARDFRDNEVAKAREVFAKHRIIQPDDPGNWQFKDFGDFAKAVSNAHASVPPTHRDRRLQAIQNAGPTQLGSESSGSDGGFAVPPNFATEISRKVMQEDSLMAQCDLRTSTTNDYTFPKDETTPWSTAAGIRVYWEDEAAQATQTKPSLTNGAIRLNKLTALVPVTDELLEDGPALTDHILKRAPEAIDFAIENAIINGIGGMRPKGILASAGVRQVSKESGQASGTILSANVRKQWNALVAVARKRAVWLAHPDADLQLQALTISGASGSVAAAAPAYTCPDATAPYGRLLGRPIRLTEACPKVGTPGDLILADLSSYVVAVKAMRQVMSMHLFFDYDLTAFRFTFRVGGQPWSDAVVPGLQANTIDRGFYSTIAAR